MTSTTAPPPVPGVEVRRIETADELLAALEVDWEVWGMERADRLGSAAVERERFDPAGSVHHFAAFLDGRRVGFARAVDMHGAVALMGGTVLREARGRGAYRALVRARWEHAAARGTPLLVVQAGDLSGPVLARLGFVTHGVVRVYADPGVGSGHGDD